MSDLTDTLSEDEKRIILEDAAILKKMGIDVGLLHIRARMLRRAGPWGGADPAEVLGDAVRAEEATHEGLFTWRDEDGVPTSYDPDLWPSMTPRRLVETRLMVGDVLVLRSPTVLRKLEELARHVKDGDEDALVPLLPGRRKGRPFDERWGDRAWLQGLENLEAAVKGSEPPGMYVFPEDVERARRLARPRYLTRHRAVLCVWFNRYRRHHGQPEVKHPDKGTAEKAELLRGKLADRQRKRKRLGK